MNLLKHSYALAFATLLSRLLGLIRVRLEASVLGGGAIASAWFLAFSIPNLFRRLLGEGALAAALTPLIAEIEAQNGPEKAKKELAVVFLYLSLILVVIVLLCSGGAILLRHLAEQNQWSYFLERRMNLALQLLPLLMPYAFFMCLIGAATAILNYAKLFFLPALGALLLNIFLISGLYFGMRLEISGEQLILYLPILSLLVLSSGLMQLILTFALLAFCGHFPKFSLKTLRGSTIIKNLFSLALPGLLGASALQVSFLVDRLLAERIGDQAVPALTYVDRLVDLPIGVFAIAIGSVLMASMTRAAAENNIKALEEELVFSLRHVYFCCIPMALAVVIFHEPLLRALCLGGNYTLSDLQSAKMVAVFYGAGIPAFCSLKVILPAFYARKQVYRPLFASLTAILVNITLNLILMQYLKQGGIALATVIASLVHNGLLLLLLKKDGIAFSPGKLLYPAVRGVVLAAFSGGTLYWLYHRFLEQKVLAIRSADITATCAVVGTMGVLYLLLAFFCKAKEPAEMFAAFRKKREKK